MKLKRICSNVHLQWQRHLMNYACTRPRLCTVCFFFLSDSGRNFFSIVMCTAWFDMHTVYPKKYAHGFCFAMLCCGYTLTDFPISIRLTSLALWQSNDCPSASKATLMNMDKYFMWIHYERLHNHNKAKHNKTVCIFLGIYCMYCQHLTANDGNQWLRFWMHASSLN